MKPSLSRKNSALLVTFETNSTGMAAVIVGLADSAGERGAEGLLSASAFSAGPALEPRFAGDDFLRLAERKLQPQRFFVRQLPVARQAANVGLRSNGFLRDASERAALPAFDKLRVGTWAHPLVW